MKKEIPTQDQNPNGLHQRYQIRKIVRWRKEGFYGLKAVTKPIDKDAEYFIMRLDEGGKDMNHIAACRIGIHAYANAIESFIPELAKDLRERYPLLQKNNSGKEAVVYRDVVLITLTGTWQTVNEVVEWLDEGGQQLQSQQQEPDLKDSWKDKEMAKLAEDFTRLQNQIEDYKHILKTFTDCPESIIDKPGLLRNKKPTDEGIEWVQKKRIPYANKILNLKDSISKMSKEEIDHVEKQMRPVEEDKISNEEIIEIAKRKYPFPEYPIPTESQKIIMLKQACFTEGFKACLQKGSEDRIVKAIEWVDMVMNTTVHAGRYAALKEMKTFLQSL